MPEVPDPPLNFRPVAAFFDLGARGLWINQGNHLLVVSALVWGVLAGYAWFSLLPRDPLARWWDYVVVPVVWGGLLTPVIAVGLGLGLTAVEWVVARAL
jgi:hypothetical protein